MERRTTADDVVRRIRRAIEVDAEAPGLVGRLAAQIVEAGAGFANPMRAEGDLVRGGTGGAAARLGIGATGQVLTVVAGRPAWAAPAGGGGGAAVRDLLTNGDATAPELVFADGDVIWIEG